MFKKIEIPAGWKESFTAYPNGRTIWEALSATVSSVNETVETVNKKVDEGLLAISAAEATLTASVNASFAALEVELKDLLDIRETDLQRQLDLYQQGVNASIAGKADASSVYTKSEMDSWNQDNNLFLLGEISTLEQATNAQLQDIVTKRGDLATLLTTAKTSIVNAINELFNSKANKTQKAWITPTLLNGWVAVDGYSVQYRKDDFGVVYFKGRVKSGLSNGYLCSLPIGYRPIQNVNKIIILSNGQISRCFIDVSNGPFLYYTDGGVWISLDNLSYPTL